jgi:hypothetical protein
MKRRAKRRHADRSKGGDSWRDHFGNPALGGARRTVRLLRGAEKTPLGDNLRKDAHALDPILAPPAINHAL